MLSVTERTYQRLILCDFRIQQVVHGSSFLTCYQQWWARERESLSVDDVEFAVLILRICSYAAQFLPSPSFTIDKIRGLPLSDIRRTCSEVGDSLAKECLGLKNKGCLVRVQHMLLDALKLQCEGRTYGFWEGISRASQAAQTAGVHTYEAAAVGELSGSLELEKEMRRRTFCVLYALDRYAHPSFWCGWSFCEGSLIIREYSQLSRQLDRLPFLPDSLPPEMVPRLRIDCDTFGEMDTDSSVPDMFTERLMQAQLGRFWRSLQHSRKPLSAWDPMEAEQRYETFSAEYVPALPSAFALNPDTRWDKLRPKLAMQRQLLHIAIFDSICWNFRPLMMLKPGHVARFPPHKKTLHQSQKRTLAIAALKQLEAVSKLHSLLGGSHIRLSAIVFYTFEATVLLLCLVSDAQYPFHQGDDGGDILGLRYSHLTRAKTVQAAERALSRLKMLSEVSDMASCGTRILSQLFVKATSEGSDQDLPVEQMMLTSPGQCHNPSWSLDFSNFGFSNDTEYWMPSSASLNEETDLMAGTISAITRDGFTDSQMNTLEFPMP